jgi:hypothetical protein
MLYKPVPPATTGGSWTFHVMHNFKPFDPNGDIPFADLFYANGKLYGANISGGNLNCGSANGCGTVFGFSSGATATARSPCG